MNRLIFGADDYLKKWTAKQIGIDGFGPSVAIGVQRDGESGQEADHVVSLANTGARRGARVTVQVFCQFSIVNPSTRSNSDVFAETRVRPADKA